MAKKTIPPAFIPNPAASKQDMLSWVLDELGCLHAWLQLTECAPTDAPISACELAHLAKRHLTPVLEMLEELEAATQSGGV